MKSDLKIRTSDGCFSGVRFANVKTQLFYSLWLALSHWQTLLVEKTVIEELGESWPWSAKRCYLNSKVNSHSIWLNLFRLTYQHPVNSNYTCMPQPYRTEMDPSASKSWKQVIRNEPHRRRNPKNLGYGSRKRYEQAMKSLQRMAYVKFICKNIYCV